MSTDNASTDHVSTDHVSTDTATCPGDAAWQEWRRAREAAVTAVPGNLSLVAHQPLSPTPAPLEQVPAVSVALAPQGDGALFVAPASAGVSVDGEPVAGEVVVGRLRPDGHPLVQVGRYWVDVFSLDGTDSELRVYNGQAPNLARFAGIAAYDFDPTWVLPAVWTAHAAVEAVAWDFSRASDTGRTKRVPGRLAVSVGEVEHELLAFLDGEALVLVFADGTTGAESYAPGRFLRMDRPVGRDAVLDLNRAFIPPCGFSDGYSCPLPPPQNRITAPVRAGEKHVLWR